MTESYETGERCETCGERKRVIWPDGGYPEIKCEACDEQKSIFDGLGLEAEDDLPW